MSRTDWHNRAQPFAPVRWTSTETAPPEIKCLNQNDPEVQPPVMPNLWADLRFGDHNLCSTRELPLEIGLQYMQIAANHYLT